MVSAIVLGELLVAAGWCFATGAWLHLWLLITFGIIGAVAGFVGQGLVSLLAHPPRAVRYP